jgi:hypothetical protein
VPAQEGAFRQGLARLRLEASRGAAPLTPAASVKLQVDGRAALSMCCVWTLETWRGGAHAIADTDEDADTATTAVEPLWWLQGPRVVPSHPYTPLRLLVEGLPAGWEAAVDVVHLSPRPAPLLRFPVVLTATPVATSAKRRADGMLVVPVGNEEGAAFLGVFVRCATQLRSATLHCAYGAAPVPLAPEEGGSLWAVRFVPYAGAWPANGTADAAASAAARTLLWGRRNELVLDTATADVTVWSHHAQVVNVNAEGVGVSFATS